ncbi:uncharacterized protein PGTG_00256 [Puccinia graminis f. sp. tritici CRL 75-36-700-3]|uniref:Uncharacterized protein n=1 Tax=Puccinia graminis f. sp. tritici (strain CRL 75-36-700-3 / race SCCL) TaxID=418459 RepID=E3JQJ5_PUCGT|nr:uncharacterized protein PGTG_00256 [Puccinia graminis f. sp. tritici CRL 75-36-700-3]EFP74300.2 hypothetical protein PGTG_00256 [Puccinia graminis f. sp. tritici CRL 75-36-700-3]
MKATPSRTCTSTPPPARLHLDCCPLIHSSAKILRSTLTSTTAPPAAPHHDSRPRGLIPRANGTTRLRPQSMVVSGTLAPASNRPPSPPPAFSVNPPRNFPPSTTFPAPRTFQPGITHQYPSTRKRGCEWHYKAVLA